MRTKKESTPIVYVAIDIAKIKYDVLVELPNGAEPLKPDMNSYASLNSYQPASRALPLEAAYTKKQTASDASPFVLQHLTLP